MYDPGEELEHIGIKGMKWGKKKNINVQELGYKTSQTYVNPDGTKTKYDNQYNTAVGDITTISSPENANNKKNIPNEIKKRKVKNFLSKLFTSKTVITSTRGKPSSTKNISEITLK